MAVADVEQDRLDALRLDRLAVGELHLEALLVERDRGVEVIDSDADVVDPSEHAAAAVVRSPSPRLAEDLGQRGDADLELLGGRLLGRDQRRWISRPGVWKASASGSPWWRSLQANISTAIEAPPRPTPARASGPGLLDQPLEQDGAADREQHHRRDQVRAAAIVLLRDRGGVVEPLLVGGDRLVLDPVVGGEVAIDEGDEGRDGTDHLDDRLAQGRRCRGARAGRRSRRGVAPIAAITRGSSNGSRAAGSRRRDQRQYRHRLGEFQRPAQAGKRGPPAAVRAPASRSEARAIEPSAARTAAAQCVGPWISSPLRSAIPPSRNCSLVAMESAIGHGARR